VAPWRALPASVDLTATDDDDIVDYASVLHEFAMRCTFLLGRLNWALSIALVQIEGSDFDGSITSSVAQQFEHDFDILEIDLVQSGDMDIPDSLAAVLRPAPPSSTGFSEPPQ